MKNSNYLITILFILFTMSVYGKKKKQTLPSIDTLYALDIIEVKKIYPNIKVIENIYNDSLNYIINTNETNLIQVAYPKEAQENNIQGTVYGRFLVDTLGNMFDIKIIKGLGGGCSETVIDMLNKVAKINHNKPSSFYYYKKFDMKFSLEYTYRR